MVRPVICTEMLYPGLSMVEKIDRIADHGFRAVEFWGWRDKNVAELADRCSERGVAVANFSGHRAGSPIDSTTHEKVLSDLREATETARTLHCPTLMLLSNELGEGGRVLDEYPNLHEEEKRSSFVALLRRALEMTPSEITIVIEPLNDRIDHPGNYLRDMKTAADIIREADSPRARILCDLYHMGVMGENLEELVHAYAPLIGYVHVADFPGRHEPGTGTADWPRILEALEQSGYTGDVGFEYEPESDSDRSLEVIRSLVHI